MIKGTLQCTELIDITTDIYDIISPIKEVYKVVTGIHRTLQYPRTIWENQFISALSTRFLQIGIDLIKS